MPAAILRRSERAINHGTQGRSCGGKRGACAKVDMTPIILEQCAKDDDVTTKYLHFKGDFEPDPGTGGAGLQITPLSGASIVTGLTLTTANDVPGRDPIAFEPSGSNDSIDGRLQRHEGREEEREAIEV